MDRSQTAVHVGLPVQPTKDGPGCLDLWPSDLENGIRVTCDVGYPCANFSFPRPLCSRLRPDVRDRDRHTSDRRQTDRRQTASSLNAPWAGAYNVKSARAQSDLENCKSARACNIMFKTIYSSSFHRVVLCISLFRNKADTIEAKENKLCAWRRNMPPPLQVLP